MYYSSKTYSRVNLNKNRRTALAYTFYNSYHTLCDADVKYAKYVKCRLHNGEMSSLFKAHCLQTTTCTKDYVTGSRRLRKTTWQVHVIFLFPRLKLLFSFNRWNRSICIPRSSTLSTDDHDRSGATPSCQGGTPFHTTQPTNVPKVPRSIYPRRFFQRWSSEGWTLYNGKDSS